MSASAAALMKLLADRRASVSRIKTIKPNPGRNRYRILPGWRTNDDPTFYHDFGAHFLKDSAGDVKAVYICVDKTFGRPCDVCTSLAAAIRMTTDDTTKRRLEDAKASSRVLLNVLALDGPTPTTPQILEVAPSVFNGKKGAGGIISLFDEWPNMLDPVNGNDIIIEKTGTGMETSYGVQIAGASKPVPPEALKNLHDLDKFVAQESEQAAARALTQVSSISGILAAPSTVQPAADRPMTPPPSEFVPAAPVAAVAAAPVAAAPEAPTPAAAVVSTGDAELDALLADLGPR